MTPHFEYLQPLFDECVELPPQQRDAWIESHLSDPADRAALRDMLAADAATGGLLERTPQQRIDELAQSSASDRLFATPHLGERIGAFVITRLLGRGGQGSVYLGERHDAQFQQRVAIKLLHQWIDNADDLRRFRRERELLARFEHPGVARLIDGGVSDSGLPYLVMEYVAGTPIDSYCRDRQLPMSTSIRVLVQLCWIIADAHRALIVHRDLKPANVLVTEAGVVKVLDFGIARLLDDSIECPSRVLAMTPGYGAPEQRVGGPITASTDVYALGVMLHELVAGTRPDPADPERRPAPATTLPEELRWIIERACASAAQERYRDAAALGEDLENYLARRPVRAHPPSPWYRVRKFVARHRGGVSFAALLVLIAATSLTYALWQGQVARQNAVRATLEAARARAQAERAETVRSFLVDLFDAAKEVLPENQRPSPNQLVRTARNRLAGQTDMSADLKADLLLTLSEVSLANDDLEETEELLKSLSDLDSSMKADSIDQLWRATLHAQLAVKRDQGESVLPLLAPFAAEIAQRRDHRIVPILETRLTALLDLNRREETLRDAFLLAERSQQVVPPLSPGDAIYYQAMPGTVLMHLGDYAKALPLLEAAVTQWRAKGLARDLTYTQLLNALAVVKTGMGVADYGSADFEEVIKLRREILTAPHELLISVLRNQSVVQRRRGDLQGAEVSARESLSMAESLYGPTHQQVMSGRSVLASVLAPAGKREQAIAVYRELTDECTRLTEHADNEKCATYFHNLGHNLRLQRQFPESLTANIAAMDWRKRLFGASHPEVGASLVALGLLYFDMGRTADALSALEQGERLYSAAGQGENRMFWSLHFARARSLRLLKRPDEALAASAYAQSLIDRQAPPNPSDVAASGLLHALLLADLGRLDEAQALARAHRQAFPSAQWRRDEAAALARLLSEH